MGGGCTNTSRQCLESSADVDDEGIQNWRGWDPCAGFVLNF